MSRSLRILALLAALLVVCVVAGSSLLGQAPTSRALGPIAEEFDQLHFRSIGPASMSGRITDFAVYEANPAIYYVATSHGGVWKTTSNGTMYEAQFQDKGEMSIGDVAVSQTNPDLVWVGTGESNNRQSVSWGSGIYKSTDGGKTYQLMGLPNSKHINRLAIDPTNENVVLVAATGPLFGSGGERGIFKTTDGGRTWKQTLKVDDDTGANDVMIAESDPRVVYASTYQRRRSQCCFNGGGPGSGIWKSTDSGETWTRLTNGLPTGNLGRIGLDVFRRSANLVYASIEGETAAGGGRGAGGAGAGGGGGRGGAPDAPAGGRGAGGAAGAGAGAGAGAAAAQAPPGRGAGAGAGAPGAAGAGAGGAGATGLYRSDDGGATWRRVSAVNPRPMYFSKVRIDPNNPDRVYMAGVGLQMTIDGGRTMETDAALVTHDDIHAIWVNPANSNHIVIGNDGGVYKSYDMAKSWQFMPNLPLALFYHAGYDMEIPFNVCGGLQDNYNWCGPSATRSTRGIRNADWFQVQGGDGFVTIIDQRDSRIVFTESQDGNMTRKNKVTGESKSIRPTATNVVNLEAGAAPFRFHWDTPMMFSPHDPGVLLAAANRLFRSTDRGDSWTVISPDLTTNADRNDVVTMGVRGADIRLSKDDGIASWPTIVSVAESPKQPGLYYTGTDDGVVSMTRDGGKTWQNITDRLTGYPKGAWTSEVVPSRFDAGTVYITSDGHRLNDYETYIWVSTDFGATFRSLNGNLKGEVVRTLTEDTKNADVLYAGTETGIFLTLDRGKSWRRLKGNLPTVRIDELTIHPRDNALIIATHGRAMWILDHLEPIQEYAAAQAASTDAKLFSIPAALQWRSKDEQNDEFWGHQFFVGENPPFDAMIQFHLKKPVGELRLKISDAAGKEVRDLLIPANRNAAGVQTVCWDMRMQPIAAPGPGGAAAGAGRGGGGGAGGPGGGRGGAPAVPGVPMPLPPSGSNPVNPCGGGAGGGGGFGGGGGVAAPLVLPGTYSVALVIDGKTVDTKPMRVIADPVLQLTDVQRKRYQDVVVDLHDMQKRGTDMTAALMPLHNEMTEIAGKIGGMANVPEAVKTQFVAANTEFAAIRAKFGVPPPQGGAAGGRGGGGGGGGGRGGGAPDENVVSRASTVKGQILAFQEMPSDYLLKAYNDVKLALPKAVADANAFLIKAMTLSQVLKKYDITLNVPAPVK